MTEKEILTKVFDDNARAYDKYRPGYPIEIIDEIIQLSHINKEDSILEIGCGTGQISMNFLDRGFSLTAIEKGDALAKIAKEKMTNFPLGKVVNSSFEDWSSNQSFKLAISAQAFHWIEKEKGLKKIYDLLAKGGSIALIWNLDKSQHTDFWGETERCMKGICLPQKGKKDWKRLPMITSNI